MRTAQAMESILRDHWLDRWDLGDLMEQGLGILTGQAMAGQGPGPHRPQLLEGAIPKSGDPGEFGW